jgi:hypothetical protein
MAWKRRCSPSAPSGEDSGERRRGKGKTELVWQPNSPPSLRFAHTFYRLPCRAAGWQLFTLTRRATRVGLSRFAGEAFGRWRGRHHASWAPESLSIRPTSRAAGKEGRLAPARPATPPRGFAAHVAVPECTDVLEDDRGPRAVTRPRGVVWMRSAWARTSLARRSPSREARSPPRAAHAIDAVSGGSSAVLAAVLSEVVWLRLRR